jgi:hypothetical protein
MRRFRWLAFAGIVLTLVVIIFAASVHFRIEPLPSAKQMRDALLDAERRHHAERLRDIPSLKNLPAIEPMTIEQALILEQIGGLFPGKREAGDALKPGPHPDLVSDFLPRMDFRAEYVTEEEARGCHKFDLYKLYDKNQPPVWVCNKSYDANGIPVTVEVQRFPNEAWPLYYAKWSPNPNILREENPDLDITRVRKFKNRVVMDRQFRPADETGQLWFFWPSGRNLIWIIYRSKVIDEEFLRRYLVKYPSSL